MEPLLPDFLDSDRLRIFVAFADTGSFTAAADRVGRSQPAVHGQVQKLQEELGHTLYTREGRAIRLTEAGRQVAAFGRQLLADTQHLQQRLHHATPGRVRLWAGSGVVRDLLAPGIQRFVHHGGRVDITTADLAAVLAHLRAGADGVGVAASVAPPPDVWSVLLTEATLCIAAPVAWCPQHADCATIHDLYDGPVVLPPADRPVYAALASVCPERPLSPVASAPGWDGILAMVDAGVGIGVVNSTCRVPPTLRLWPLCAPGLPVAQYRLFARKGGPRGPLRDLAMHLQAALHEANGSPVDESVEQGAVAVSHRVGSRPTNQHREPLDRSSNRLGDG